ncbi:hypothetical protein C8F04DRAFT_1241531 [Mycena alexandri]|uniref:Uncharacterized protein n=1 Tax=Mycena alexandri TaxID=1745969 RepID=A0AAD6S5B6_9AGAR|nr:hypothetical protein C8F04DRAFT_1241531 [Mycena alexandri]
MYQAARSIRPSTRTFDWLQIVILRGLLEPTAAAVKPDSRWARSCAKHDYDVASTSCVLEIQLVPDSDGHACLLTLLKFSPFISSSSWRHVRNPAAPFTAWPRIFNIPDFKARSCLEDVPLDFYYRQGSGSGFRVELSITAHKEAPLPNFRRFSPSILLPRARHRLLPRSGLPRSYNSRSGRSLFLSAPSKPIVAKQALPFNWRSHA